MKGYQCKCGKITGSNTGESFQECEGCDKCNTTFAHHPDYHKELKPHTWGIKYNQNTGKPYKICDKCYHIDKDSYNESKNVSNS